MGSLICKIKEKKGKYNEKFKFALKEKNPYETFEKYKKIEYNLNYKLEEDEIFYISQIDVVKNKDIFELEETSSLYMQITNEEWKKVDFIAYVENSCIYYQKNIGKKYLSTKIYLKCLEGKVTLKKEQEGIALNQFPDALYIKNEKKLYFRDFFKASKIFSGLENLYRDATETEINTFFQIGFIERDTEFKNEEITSAKRKKIALILEKLKNKNIQGKYVQYGKKYCVDLFENEKIKVKNNEDLSKVLEILEEKFYESEVSLEKRCSNSFRSI